MAEPVYVHGEILSPRSQTSSIIPASNENLNYVATLLDDMFTVPGTSIRFGLDAIIGWIPGIGDLLAAIASLFIVFAAWTRGVARITLFRMLLNLTLEATLGAIPLVGDAAHVAWKANRRNYNLLIRDQNSRRRQTWGDWMFVIVAMTVMMALVIGPWILLIHLVRSHHWL